MSFKLCEFIKSDLEICGRYIYTDECYCTEHTPVSRFSFPCFLSTQKFAMYIQYLNNKLCTIQ